MLRLLKLPGLAVKAMSDLLDSLIDAVPPYRFYEGAVEEKKRDDQGRAWIRVGPDFVEVDTATYESLEVGERIRLRYTRAKKAVSIDKLVPPGDTDDDDA